MTASAQTVFDEDLYLRQIEARGQLIGQFVPRVKPALGLRTALDAGCGIGFFANLLQNCGLEVRAFDGRQSNVDEARRRFPGIAFHQGDIEDSSIVGLGACDFVLCFGLLYHLENPMRAIRHLRGLTGKILLLESMCIPRADTYMVLREEPRNDSQSLTDLAFYASEGCIVKMLYRSGFSAVYRVGSLPDHEDFKETRDHIRRRTVLLAAYQPVFVPGLIPLAEPHEDSNPWEKPISAKVKYARFVSSLVRSPARIYRFLHKPLHDQSRSFYARWRQHFPELPVPVRLPYGVWFMGRNDYFGANLTHDGFETAERAFVQGFLQPGMTVLDVGAHHGLYTLLASKCVGRAGMVVAFEPSPRERKALLLNLRLNRTKNVRVEPIALGDRNTQAELYVVAGEETGSNSLRPPVTSYAVSPTQVDVRRLDDWAAARQLDHADFIKLDVEGGELEFLQGAKRFLTGDKRPVILAEVQDIRTKPWGYEAKEIIQFLVQLDYQWFALSPDGLLAPTSHKLDAYDANLVALPEERTDEILQSFRQK